MVGTHKTGRCTALWAAIQEWYEETGVVDRLQNLLPTMLEGKRVPKLRGSGACVRALVPFAALRATAYLTDNPVDVAVRAAATHLWACHETRLCNQRRKGLR